MQSIAHRELRNSSADILRRVEAGESFTVTNHGRPVAVISPVHQSGLDAARSRGEIREALKPLSSLRDLEPRRSPVSTAEILRDLRGDR